jgi:hypothetical protein
VIAGGPEGSVRPVDLIGHVSLKAELINPVVIVCSTRFTTQKELLGRANCLRLLSISCFWSHQLRCSWFGSRWESRPWFCSLEDQLVFGSGAHCSSRAVTSSSEDSETGTSCNHAYSKQTLPAARSTSAPVYSAIKLTFIAVILFLFVTVIDCLVP